MTRRRKPRERVLVVRHHDGSETTHATRDEAYAAAVADMRDGEKLAMHASDCAKSRRRKCDCEPVIVVIRRGQA